MLSRHDVDQAEGLRRLLLPPSLRVITILGARPSLGATSVTINLAAAFAAAGREVLVLDENHAHDNVASTLALKPRYDLLNVVYADRHLHDVVLQTETGVQVLPLARAMKGLPVLRDEERERLLESLGAATRGMNVVLVDASAAGHSVCASLGGDEPLLLVLNPTSSGITESYALLKQMAMRHGRSTFDIVVNKARNEHEARAVFDNMQQVAQRHLHVRLSYLGYVPQDDLMKRATQLCKPAVELFPAAPAALALAELARRLMVLPVTNESSHGLTRVMQRLMQQSRTGHAMQH